MKKIIKISCLLLLGILLTGCARQDERSLTKYARHDDMAHQISEFLHIRQYFQRNESVTYHLPMTALSPDHVFSFEMSQEVYNQMITLNGYSVADIFTVFTDDDLTKSILTDSTFGQGTLRVAPSYLGTSFGDSDERFSNANNWGYFSHYYLVQHFDLETGAKLEVPIVTVFTIDRPLDRPILTIHHEDDGSFTLAWDAVDHAEHYELVRIDFTGESQSFEVHLIDTTPHTSWNSKVEGQNIEQATAQLFGSYLTSKDQQIANNELLWWNTYGALSIGSLFGVVARNDAQRSNLSFLSEDQLDRNAFICEAAPFAVDEVMSNLTVETIDQIPAFLPATACSGDTIQAPISIDFDQVSWQNDRLHVPYVFNDSKLGDYFEMSHSDAASYMDELRARQIKMEELYQQNERHDYRYQSTRFVAFDARKSYTLPEISDTIFSTSDLETFIVSNLIDGAAMIDISHFRTDDVDIFELFDQIRYQNPMILQFRDFWYDFENQVIFVHFLYDPETRATIQQTIRDEVSSIANEITTPEMSEAEKVIAINQFIIDHTTYDEDAYESIRSESIYLYNEDFFHASTAGGVFIQGYAVCEGYAAAFMLLTDYVGIPSIAVTGHTVDDPGRHMWNRVLIGDQWYVVDPTHNDQEQAKNSVLLLADDLADQIYIEDRLFLINRKLDDFRAPLPSIHEYYYSHGLLANDVAEAIDLLIYQLQSASNATIRVPLDTTDSQFGQIGQAVTDHFHRSSRSYWINGVFHISLQ